MANEQNGGERFSGDRPGWLKRLDDAHQRLRESVGHEERELAVLKALMGVPDATHRGFPAAVRDEASCDPEL